MKTNTTFILRPLVTAALLLSIAAGLSSCDSAEPVKPESANGPVLPAVVPDTLTIDPNEPTPTPIVPIVKLPDLQLPDRSLLM